MRRGLGRAAGATLAAVAALGAWPSAAPAQNSRPIPYSQLVHGQAPAPRERPKPKPRRTPRPAVAPGAAAGVGAGGAVGVPIGAGLGTSSPVAPPFAPLPTVPLPTAPAPETPRLAQSGGSVSGLRPPARLISLPALAPAPPASAAAPPPPELPLAAAAAPAPVSAGARLAPGAPPPPGEVEAFVDGLVRQAAVQRPLAGVAVAVVQGGALVLERGYGQARPGAPVDPRATLFRLGSVSKVFTWIEVLKAVEAGRLRLDEPVNARLPRALAVPDDGFRTPVRLRNLMAHDAGFESREFGRLFRPAAADRRTLAETLATERPHRVRAPGEMPTYSTYGAALAGELAAEAAHLPFDRLVQDDLLRPAGLLHTGSASPGRRATACPRPWRPPWRPSWLRATPRRAAGCGRSPTASPAAGLRRSRRPARPTTWRASCWPTWRGGGRRARGRSCGGRARTRRCARR